MILKSKRKEKKKFSSININKCTSVYAAFMPCSIFLLLPYYV